MPQCKSQKLVKYHKRDTKSFMFWDSNSDFKILFKLRKFANISNRKIKKIGGIFVNSEERYTIFRAKSHLENLVQLLHAWEVILNNYSPTCWKKSL